MPKIELIKYIFTPVKPVSRKERFKNGIKYAFGLIEQPVLLLDLTHKESEFKSRKDHVSLAIDENGMPKTHNVEKVYISRWIPGEEK